jgi:hypothetical protein
MAHFVCGVATSHGDTTAELRQAVHRRAVTAPAGP